MTESLSVAAPRTGYSAQTSIALEVADLINNGRIRFWCASVMNPLDNQLSSNPMAIFAALSRFVRGGLLDQDLNAALTREANLIKWVQDMGEGLDAGVRKETLAAIKEAFQERSFEVKMFRLTDLTLIYHKGESDEFIVQNEPWGGRCTRQMGTLDLDRDL